MRLGALILTAALPCCAQFWSRATSPKVDAVLTHPPGLGLKVERVAVLPGRDANSQELADQLTASFVRTRAVEVVDRRHVDPGLGDQELAAGGSLDSVALASLGKRLGPTALLSVNVNRCDFSRSQATREERTKDKKGVEQVRVEKRSITALDFSVGVQVVDLATGKIFRTQTLEENPSRFAASYDGWPAHPREAEVRREAFDRAQTRIMHMLLPWTETRRLTFFDDREFGMKSALAPVVARDYRWALVLSLKGLDQAKGDPTRKPKYYPRAWYNVGIIHFICGEYEEARPYLQKAAELQPDVSPFKEAHQECLDALDLQTQLRKVTDRSPTSARPDTPPKLPPFPSSTAGEGRPGLEERLKKLQELYRKGLLDKKEYEAKKAEILKEL